MREKEVRKIKENKKGEGRKRSKRAKGVGIGMNKWEKALFIRNAHHNYHYKCGMDGKIVTINKNTRHSSDR